MANGPTSKIGSGYPAERGQVELWVRRPTDLARRVAKDAAGNVIETDAHKGRVAHFDHCKEIASTRGVRCELGTAASDAFLACSCWAGTDESIVAATKLRRKNHEKNALDHCLGSSGVLCVGTVHTATAYEDARRAAAATNHKHDHHHY
jgi:hypothetical protein